MKVCSAIVDSLWAAVTAMTEGGRKPLTGGMKGDVGGMATDILGGAGSIGRKLLLLARLLDDAGAIGWNETGSMPDGMVARTGD